MEKSFWRDGTCVHQKRIISYSEILSTWHICIRNNDKWEIHVKEVLLCCLDEIISMKNLLHCVAASKHVPWLFNINLHPAFRFETNFLLSDIKKFNLMMDWFREGMHENKFWCNAREIYYESHKFMNCQPLHVNYYPLFAYFYLNSAKCKQQAKSIFYSEYKTLMLMFIPFPMCRLSYHFSKGLLCVIWIYVSNFFSNLCSMH